MGVSVFCNPRISGGMSWGCCFRPRFAASRGPSHARPRRLYASGGRLAICRGGRSRGGGGDGCQGPTASPRHARRENRRSRVRCRALEVGRPHGWGPPPPHAVGPPSAIGPISPRVAFRAVGGLSASGRGQLPRTRAFLSPRGNWAGRACGVARGLGDAV